MWEKNPVKALHLQDCMVDVLTFGMVLTSSFDIFLTIDIFGFNVRITNIFQTLLVCAAFFKCLQQRAFLIPRNFVFLGVFALINLACTFHTVLPMWNIAYDVWLILFVMMIWAIGILYADRFTRLLEIYIISFYLMAGYGILQFLLGITGISNWMITQWWIEGFPRVNGFTYEPSYYGTYMIMGYLLAQSCCLFDVKKIGKVPMRPLCYLSTAAIVLCSSRMIYIPIGCMLLFSLVKLVVCFRKKQTTLKRAVVEFARQSAIIIMVALYFLLMQISLNTQNTANTLPNSESPEATESIRAENILLRNVGANGDAANIYTRLDGWKTSWELFCESPIYGYGLGGISAEGMRLKGMSREQMIAYGRGAFTGNVFLEILAATGIFGTFAFLIYGFSLVSPSFFQKRQHAEAYYIELSLVIALIGECMLLAMNQNILRSYTWIHVAILSCCLIKNEVNKCLNLKI